MRMKAEVLVLGQEGSRVLFFVSSRRPGFLASARRGPNLLKPISPLMARLSVVSFLSSDRCVQWSGWILHRGTSMGFANLLV